MNLSDIGVVCGLCSTLFVGGAAGGKYYMDHEYVAVGGLNEAFIQRDIRDLKKDIRSLEYDREHGGLTDKEQWELEELRDELEDLQ